MVSVERLSGTPSDLVVWVFLRRKYGVDGLNGYGTITLSYKSTCARQSKGYKGTVS